MATNTIMPPLTGFSPARAGNTVESKANYYTELLRNGFTDPEIRQAATAAMGPQPDADWDFLKSQAGPAPTFNSDLVRALRRGSYGPMTNNPGVTFWDLNRQGTPLTFRNRTPGGANNPPILTMPDYVAPPPSGGTDDQTDPPDDPSPPDLTFPDPDPPLPDPDPPVTPEDPDVEVIPVPDPDPIIETPLDPDPPKTGTVTIEDFTPLDDPVEDPPAEDPPKTGTVTIEDFTPIDNPIAPPPPPPPPDDEKKGTVTIEDFTPIEDPIEEILDDMDWGDTDVSDAEVVLDDMDWGDTTVADDDKVGTVTIEAVDDNTDVTMLDPTDNDPFGWDVYEDPTTDAVDISGDDGGDWWWQDQGFSNSFGFNFDQVDEGDPFGWDEWTGADDNDPFGWDDWYGELFRNS